MGDKNKIIKVVLDSMPDFAIEVAELSEDSLTLVFENVPTRTAIDTPDAYIDYTLAKTVVNLKELLVYIKALPSGQLDIGDLRKDLVIKAWEINPVLNPNNVVITKNGELKIVGLTGSLEDGTLLSESNAWSIDDPLDEKKDDKKAAAVVRAQPGQLPFVVVQKWWKRINQYLNVKKYNESDAYSLIGGKFFHSRTNFNTFIVSICIVDYEDLFSLLDEMGIPKHITPPQLMLELYELCMSCNPFLTYEASQKFFDKDSENAKNNKSGGNKNAKAGMSMSKSMENKPKKRFSDVPKEDLVNLETNMRVSLIGQDDAVRSMCSAIQRASVGLKDPQRPIGSFLLAGRSGCGKTLSSKVLADTLIKDRDNLINIDCSEYSADHEYAKLIGAPNGYTGYEQGGMLTNAIMTNPFAVVVFDEIEKASTKLHQLLLQILEEGRLTDGKGQTVSFKDTVVIMTSNVGVEDIDSISKTIGFGDVAKITDDKKDKALQTAIKKKFKPEFLNRIDEIIYFRELTKDDYMRIIDLELYKLNDNLKANDTEYSDMFLVFDSKVRNLVFKNGINQEYGARPLKRYIENHIATPLARQVLMEFHPERPKVAVGAAKGAVTFKFMTKESLIEIEALAEIPKLSQASTVNG